MPDRSEPKVEMAELYVNAYLVGSAWDRGTLPTDVPVRNSIVKQRSKFVSGLKLRGYLTIADNKPKEARLRASAGQPDSARPISLLVQNLFSTHKDYGPLDDLLYARFMELKRPRKPKTIGALCDAALKALLDDWKARLSRHTKNKLNI